MYAPAGPRTITAREPNINLWRMPTVAMTLRTVPLTAGLLTLLALAPAAQATSFGDMFNPGRWFGGGHNNDDYYDEGPWGGPYGGGPWGGPYGGPYGGYGAPGYGYGYGAPGYGYPPAAGYGVPGYGAPAAPAVQAAPATSDSAKDRELETLRRRIEQLESRQSAPGAPAAPATQGAPGGAESWPSAPAFRPMDQY